MDTWEQIHDFSEKVFRRLLQTEEVRSQSEVDGIVEDVVHRLEEWNTVSERLQQQYCFDAEWAYGRLKFRRIRRVLRWWSVVAAMVCLGIVGWAWLHTEEPVAEALLAEEIRPGVRKAVLTLSDGAVWQLGDSVMLIPSGERNIRIDSCGIQLQMQRQTEPESEEVYHLLTVPRGGEFYMTLADGTQVWLNSESELRFPIQFAGKERKVMLTGEAYFQVKKNSAHPFIVEVGDARVQVLGTGFNVSSYVGDGRIVTTLVEGTVCFEAAGKRVLLAPGEQSVLDKEGRLEKRVVDPFPYVAWKDGYFVFRKQRLGDIMNIVSRWYNVPIRFEEKALEEISFSGGLMRDEGFEALMKMIEETKAIRYSVKDGTVVIAPICGTVIR